MPIVTKVEGLVDGFGNPVFVDQSIGQVIKRINDLGFKTHISCSGMMVDHPEEKIIYQPKVGQIVFFRRDNPEELVYILKNLYEEVGLVIELLDKVFIVNTPVVNGNKTMSDLFDEGKGFFKDEEHIIPISPTSFSINPFIYDKGAEKYGGYIYLSDREKMTLWEKFIYLLEEQSKEDFLSLVHKKCL